MRVCGGTSRGERKEEAGNPSILWLCVLRSHPLHSLSLCCTYVWRVFYKSISHVKRHFLLVTAWMSLTDKMAKFIQIWEIWTPIFLIFYKNWKGSNGIVSTRNAQNNYFARESSEITISHVSRKAAFFTRAHYMCVESAICMVESRAQRLGAYTDKEEQTLINFKNYKKLKN